MRSAPLLLLALVGCQQVSAPVSQEQQAPVAGPVAPAALAEVESSPVRPQAGAGIAGPQALVGEYRVAGVDGAGIDLPHGITARIDEEAIHVASDCVRLAWSHVFEGADLATEQLFPSESCGRALLPEEQAIVTALGSATRITRTPANGIEFSGRGHSVLLFSQ